MKIGNREISFKNPPLIIPDIGINHFGKFDLAVKMINNIHSVGGEIVKFQCHISEAEMLKDECKNIIPINSSDNSSIYDIIDSCVLTFEEEKELKRITEKLGMIYLSTPFSREAVDRLEEMNVALYKIGSGEFGNLPLVEYIASKRKPMILSTGMNDLGQLYDTIDIIESYKIDYILLVCTSLYPTPYDRTKLHMMEDLQEYFGKDNIGISDHSIGNYIGYAATVFGAVMIEKHFTLDKSSIGPDILISMDSKELKEMIAGCNALYETRNNKKVYDILSEEQITSKFAFASIVSIKDIKKGDVLALENVWVKRPGIGILSKHYNDILGRKVKNDIKKDTLLKWEDIEVE